MTKIISIDPMFSLEHRMRIYNEAIDSRPWEHGFIVGHTLNSMPFAFHLSPAREDQEPDSVDDMERAFQKCLEARKGTGVHQYASVYLEVF